jgi:hypothetical protein
MTIMKYKKILAKMEMKQIVKNRYFMFVLLYNK